MKIFKYCQICFLGFIMALSISGCKENNQTMKLSYPETKKIEASDTFFNELVNDPYRWLENDTSAETADWVKRQNDFTFSFLEQIPFRADIKNRLTTLYDYEKYSAPFKEGKFTYFFKNDGLQNQSVLYRQLGNEEATVFFDPNQLSNDGTVSLSGLSFTEDGSLMAYSISRGGADWQEIYILNTETGKLLNDLIPDAKFSGITWYGSKGFFYSKYPKVEGSKLSAKTQNHQLYYHQLGTNVKNDRLVFGGKDFERRYVGAFKSDESDFLLVSAAMTTSGNELYIINLSSKDWTPKPISSGFEYDEDPVLVKANFCYLLTNRNAPNKRLVKLDLLNPSIENWVDIVKEKEEVLSVNKGAGKFFTLYLKHAISEVYQIDYEGNVERKVALPGVGTAIGFSGEEQDSVLYFIFSSYISPSTVYSYQVADGRIEIFKKPNVDFNPDVYTSHQVFYTSKDGTQVPMIITHKKDLKKDGKNPLLLYGYGGFNISLTPAFNTSVVMLLEQGGVYAVPNIRGGGEYGEAWHKAGTLMKKQNVFDDFIAAAEYLIKEGYTSSDFLALSGGSNGGLLVGAVMTQQPTLARVAFPAVGVLDMLRYHKFTAGAGWATDYGTAEDSPEMFKYLRAYSPVHAIKTGTAYPATMVTTGDHDDRVVPAHSFKFIATLQAAQEGEWPTLIRIDVNAGHGAGKPTSKVIEEQADKFAFMFWNMGFKSLPIPYPSK